MIDIHKAVKEQYSNKKLFISLLIGIAVFVIFLMIYKIHQADTSWGWFSLLPTISVLTIAIISRRPFESIIAGVIAGLVMLDPANLITSFADNLSKVMGNTIIIWIILVCGLMGGFIKLLEISGCLSGFNGWLKSIIKSRKGSMLATAVLGSVVFLDDYLSCLAVSLSVRKLTDHYKVSREKIAYLIDSTAAPMCVLVPISTWAVFFSGLLEENHLTKAGQGLSLYISAIPFMAYAWSALVIVFLVGLGIVKDFGPMKKAEARAKNGQPIPPNFASTELTTESKALRKTTTTRQLFNFFFPMSLLVAATIYYDIDLLKGVIVACTVTVISYYFQGLLSFEAQANAIFEGFGTMLYPLSTVIAGFLLKEINDSLGMTQYIIDTVTPYLNKETYPAIVFIILALIVFGTASSWGVFIIAIPIVIPMAQHLNVHMPLVIGALLSASSFGSHACFFSDSSLLAAQGSGCSPMAHAFTQFPYAVLGAITAVTIFLVLGCVYA